MAGWFNFWLIVWLINWLRFINWVRESVSQSKWVCERVVCCLAGKSGVVPCMGPKQQILEGRPAVKKASWQRCIEAPIQYMSYFRGISAKLDCDAAPTDVCTTWHNRSIYSLSGRTSFRKNSWSLEAARFGFRFFQSLQSELPRRLLNFRAIRSLWYPISCLRDFMRSYGKTSVRLVNRGPDCY